MMQLFNNQTRAIVLTLVVVIGVSLIIGATANLPASAQGIVTGRNDILIDQLADRVGTRELTQAVIDAGAIEADQQPAERRADRHQARRRGDRIEGRQDWGWQGLEREGRQNGNALRATQRNRGANRGFQDLDDQLERLGPEVVYQIAVDAGLITQVDSERMLRQ